MSTLRTSSYTISVKLEEEEDKYMLVHGYTGAIDIVNGKIAEYLQINQKVLNEKLPFTQEVLEKLTSRGYLTDKNEQEEHEFVIKFASLLHQKHKILTKNFVFLIAYDCNFRCPYCYESQTHTGNNQWSKQVFTKKMVDKAYDTISQIEPNSKLRPKVITLYGGEPLLSQNKEIVEYIIDKGKHLGYSFFAVTNGYDLADFKHLLNPNTIQKLQITVDGSEETHNKRRIHYKETKSFNRIIQNIGLALDCGVTVSVRVNTDKNNFKDLNKLNEIFKELNYFEKKGKLIPYSALLFDYNRNTEVHPTNKKNTQLNFLEQTEFNALHKSENYRHACHISNKAQEIKNAITKNRPLKFSSINCSAQSGSYILDPFGDIYTCWNEVGNKSKVIGNFFDFPSIEWNSNKLKWQNQNIGTSPLCSKCKYGFICHGGCISHSEIRKGTFEPGFCNDFSETFGHAINLIYHKLKASSKLGLN